MNAQKTLQTCGNKKKDLDNHLRVCNKNYENKLKSTKQCDKCKAIYFINLRYNKHVKTCDGSSNCVPKRHEFRAATLPSDDTEGNIAAYLDETTFDFCYEDKNMAATAEVAATTLPSEGNIAAYLDETAFDFCYEDKKMAAETTSDSCDEDKKMAAI